MLEECKIREVVGPPTTSHAQCNMRTHLDRLGGGHGADLDGAGGESENLHADGNVMKQDKREGRGHRGVEGAGKIRI